MPEAERPLHRVAPDDFLLNEKLTSNPALGTASDGLNLGFQVDRLPSLPAEPAGGSESKSGKEKGEKKEKSAPHGTDRAMKAGAYQDDWRLDTLRRWSRG